MDPRRPEQLAAIARRLWREVGFADPEPDILPFLPSLVVAWSNGSIGDAERERILEHARELSDPLQAWVADRLRHPPGPYFRYQAGHLLSFMAGVWTEGSELDAFADECTALADELIQDAGWLRRLFGGVAAERRHLAEIQAMLEEHQIDVSDRLWALAQGRHAGAEPRQVAAVREDDDQSIQARAITVDDPEQRLAVGAYSVLVRDEDLDQDEVLELLSRWVHLREPERWIVLAERIYARGRPLTARQRQELAQDLQGKLGHPFEEVPFAELAYLEDALAADARWVSWLPGQLEELRVDREEVVRCQCPGTFRAPRARVRAEVGKTLVGGPAGLGFRTLHVETGDAALRLSSPVITAEPPSAEAVAWLARFLPAMADPCTQLVLDETDGPRWVAEVHSHLPSRPSTTREPILPGRSLLVPPWVWFRAANALGVRFFAGRRRTNHSLH